MTEEPEPQEELIPKRHYDALEADFKDVLHGIERLTEENSQLKETIRNLGSGITKASEITENIDQYIETRDKEMIAKIAFAVVPIAGKHKPTHITIKYKGNEMVDVQSNR